MLTAVCSARMQEECVGCFVNVTFLCAGHHEDKEGSAQGCRISHAQIRSQGIRLRRVTACNVSVSFYASVFVCILCCSAAAMKYQDIKCSHLWMHGIILMCSSATEEAAALFY